MFSRVDLPAPDGPMIATNSPWNTSSDTERNEEVALLPRPKTRLTSRSDSNGIVASPIGTASRDKHVRSFWKVGFVLQGDPPVRLSGNLHRHTHGTALVASRFAPDEHVCTIRILSYRRAWYGLCGWALVPPPHDDRGSRRWRSKLYRESDAQRVAGDIRLLIRLELANSRDEGLDRRLSADRNTDFGTRMKLLRVPPGRRSSERRRLRAHGDKRIVFREYRTCRSRCDDHRR